jgi:hypothetical protein
MPSIGDKNKHVFNVFLVRRPANDLNHISALIHETSKIRNDPFCLKDFRRIGFYKFRIRPF